jgi:hypothetical protein
MRGFGTRGDISKLGCTNRTFWNDFISFPLHNAYADLANVPSLVVKLFYLFFSSLQARLMLYESHNSAAAALTMAARAARQTGPATQRTLYQMSRRQFPQRHRHQQGQERENEQRHGRRRHCPAARCPRGCHPRRLVLDDVVRMRGRVLTGLFIVLAVVEVFHVVLVIRAVSLPIGVVGEVAIVPRQLFPEAMHHVRPLRRAAALASGFLLTPRPPRNVDGARWRGRRRGRRRFVVVVGHLELDSHVVRGTLAPDAPVHITFGRGGDEVVVLAGPELHSSGCWCERPEGYGEVHQLMRLCALGDDAGIWVADATRVELLLVDTVDDVGLDEVRPRTPLVQRADDVHLVVLPRLVASIHVNNVIRVVYPKYWIARVPVHIVVLSHGRALRDEAVEQKQLHQRAALSGESTKTTVFHLSRPLSRRRRRRQQHTQSVLLSSAMILLSGGHLCCMIRQNHPAVHTSMSRRKKRSCRRLRRG